MKYLFPFLLLFINLSGASQIAEGWCDYQWKSCLRETANYYFIQEKTDTGWFRRDFYVHTRQIVRRALYQDSNCKKLAGTAMHYYPNGQISAFEQKKDQVDFIVGFHGNGMMDDSGYFYNKQQVGVRLRWHSNGYMLDSITKINDSTLSVISWFDDGNPAAAGLKVNDRKQGKWKYFHHNGKIAGDVLYNKDKIITQLYYNEDGSLQPDIVGANIEADFKKNGKEGWKKYLKYNTGWPAGYKLANTNQVTVTIEFCVNEEGKITDVKVIQPFDTAFDKQALQIIKQSPLWIPEIEHNRKVKAWRRQPITFVQY